MLALLGLATGCGFSGAGLGAGDGPDATDSLDGNAHVTHGQPDTGGGGFDATNPLDGGVLLPDCGAAAVLDGDTCVACDAGTVAKGGSCVACGESGQPCCANEVCNAPNGCTNGTCTCTPVDCCAGKQCGSCTDKCGTMKSCPSQCTGSQVCDKNACCTPKTDCGGICGDVSDGCGGVLHCSTDCGNGNCCGGNECRQCGCCQYYGPWCWDLVCGGWCHC
jgi:hypothetical protein